MFCLTCILLYFIFFFFNDTATTEIYTLSLHDALPIFSEQIHRACIAVVLAVDGLLDEDRLEFHGLSPIFPRDRKSTRLNSSHGYISYAVFCLKKKKNTGQCVPTRSQVIPCVRTCYRDT